VTSVIKQNRVNAAIFGFSNTYIISTQAAVVNLAVFFLLALFYLVFG